MQLTKQEVFNIVWDWFVVKQKPASMDAEEVTEAGAALCRYRDSAGNKCALGILIPDKDYKPELEVETVGGIMTLFHDLLGYPIPGAEDNNYDLLARLQQSHDMSAEHRVEDEDGDHWITVPNDNFHSEVRDSLLNVAIDFGLTIPKGDTHADTAGNAG